MSKPKLIIILLLILALIVGIFFFMRKSTPATTPVIEDTSQTLPINTLDLSERPFITLSPDKTGRSLDISVAGAPVSGSMEYEMIYNASGKQEGALGSISLGSETQPIVKAILLGSKSGGGKITYHEGVTGGSITLTYDETRLKESWNYLHFDPTDPVFTTTDGRFIVTLPKTGLKKDEVIVTMKTFGYEKTGLPADAKVIAGPYGYFPQTKIKGTAMVELKLPAGEFTDPTIYGWDGKTWTKLVTKLEGEIVSTSSTSNVFIVTAQ